MKKRNKAMLSVTLILVLSFILGGCSKKLQQSDVTYSKTVLDDITTGIKENNYDEFSKDFSEFLKTNIDKDYFKNFSGLLSTKVGDYESSSFDSASEYKKNDEQYTTVVYKAKYTKENKDVTITMTFSDSAGKKLLEGLVFNSHNLMN